MIESVLAKDVLYLGVATQQKPSDVQAVFENRVDSVLCFHFCFWAHLSSAMHKTTITMVNLKRDTVQDM